MSMRDDQVRNFVRALLGTDNVDNVERVIVDIGVDEVVRAHVTRLGSAGAFKLRLPTCNVEVIQSDGGAGGTGDAMPSSTNHRVDARCPVCCNVVPFFTKAKALLPGVFDQHSLPSEVAVGVDGQFAMCSTCHCKLTAKAGKATTDMVYLEAQR